MNYNDGGLNYNNFLAYIMGTPPAFQNKFMPYYSQFFMNNIIKKNIPESELEAISKRKDSQSLLSMLLGG